MRVTVIGKQFPDSLARNFSVTLQHMGYTVQEIDEDRVAGVAFVRDRIRRVHRLAELHPKFHELRDRRVTRAVLASTPDVVLNTYAGWHPDAVAEARSGLRPRVPLIFLYPDPTAHLVREFPLAAGYDVLYFKDPHSVAMFRSRLGINAHYLPEACNSRWHRPVDLTPRDVATYGCDLTTAGSLYYYRALQLEPFAGYDMKIWGTNLPGWMSLPVRSRYVDRFIAEEEKARAFRAAKIVLNTHTEKEFAGTNARTFEAAGCGAFQIADWRPVLADLFDPDHEIVTYESREELKEKVDFYLAHPDARRRIAEAGCRRAHAEHTYEHRIRTMFSMVLGTAA
ncbi:MAG TPA: glycosyltransferase [Chloroflexota bacterium]|nr:glycosyltransferase [Chloroflexota bacterium]